MASPYTKEQLENMLEDVVNELDLSEEMVEKHGPLGTPPAELVRLVLEQKNREIYLLRHSYKKVEPQVKVYSRDECIFNYCSHPDTCEELDKCYSPKKNQYLSPDGGHVYTYDEIKDHPQFKLFKKI